jgi:hypothetical protein
MLRVMKSDATDEKKRVSMYAYFSDCPRDCELWTFGSEVSELNAHFHRLMFVLPDDHTGRLRGRMSQFRRSYVPDSM